MSTRHDERLVRAAYDSRTITVYQAYSSEIAASAARAGTFVAPFSRQRMTWIKPSFGWMMHRCGWGRKGGQEHVLAIAISRSGFEWALAHSCLSHYDPAMHENQQAWAAAKAGSPAGRGLRRSARRCARRQRYLALRAGEPNGRFRLSLWPPL
jgi:hypothetical protein